MPAIKLHVNGDGCWPDLTIERLQTGEGIINMMGNDQPPLELAALRGGMASGATSVTLRINLPDGQVLLTETSLALLDMAVQTFKGAHENNG